MTDQLFGTPDAVMVRSAPERLGRWVLHRAGIVNVWQYDRAELLFAGGRVLLRGSNGAGKSKALEVLLPFLLDGNTRAIDATSRDRTTIYWLMTDGRGDGNHVGYVWLELRLSELDDAGEIVDRFLTIGAGLKAATSTRQTATWFFMTEAERIPEALELGPEVSVERLREHLGNDAVTQSAAEHRRRVALKLFGLEDEDRYRSLIHLLHRLRDPNIGNRVEAGELAALLRDSLPPVSELALDKAGERFDALDQIREQLEGMERTATAVQRFLVDYSAYARERLADRAKAVADADANSRRQGRERERLASELAQIAIELRAAEEDVEQLREAGRRAGAELEALQKSEAYQQHRQLDDRRKALEALTSQAAMATKAAADGAALADKLAEIVQRSEKRVEEARQAVAGTRATLLRAAKTAEIDAAAVAREASDIPTSIAVAEGRRRVAQQVRRLATRWIELAASAARAEEQAARSESELAHRQAKADETRARWHEVTRSWCAAVGRWAQLPLPDVLAGEAVSAIDDRRLRQLLGELMSGDATAADAAGAGAGNVRSAGRGAGVEDLAAVAAMVREMVAPVRRAVLNLRERAQSRRDVAAGSLSELEAQYGALAAEEEARPSPSRFREAERDPSTGAAFYELVELTGGLDEREVAGLEAALESSGLLDAWVSREGVVIEATTHDVLWRPDASRLSPGTPTLADVLVANEDHVAGLLRTIALGEVAPAADGPVPAYVTLDGRWGLPPLFGAWEKPIPEFLGTPTRRATRERRLAELRRHIEEARQVLEAAEQHVASVERSVEAVETWIDGIPSDSAVRSAAAETAVALGAVAEGQTRYDDDRNAAELAGLEATTARTELDHAAAADTLPLDPDELDVVASAAAELAEELRRWEKDWRYLKRLDGEFVEARSDHAQQATAAAEAREQDVRLGGELRREEVAFRTLEDAIGASVAEVLRRIEDADRRKRRANDEEPAAQQRERDLAERRGEARARVEEADRLLEEAASSISIAVERLRAALRLPGVLAAALPDLDGETAAGRGDKETAAEDPLAKVAGGDGTDRDVVAAARALLERSGSLPAGPVSDGAILNRLHALSDGLAGGYDVVDNEVDGIKFVMIADDSGRQPLPELAARVTSEVAAARERLAAGERETVERFLLGEVSEEVRERLLEAHDLVRSANDALKAVRSSHGKGAHLAWSVDEEAPEGARIATKLLVSSPRSAEEDARLRDALMSLVRAERDRDPAVSYGEHLRVALDYRRWYRFSVQVTDSVRGGSPRVLSARLGLSQGEQRVLSYLALFAAASAHFDSIGGNCPRLLLLDDAFATVDEPTHERLLRLLVDLNLDFVITSERMWGCFPRVPSLEIYEALRDPAVRGVALVHFHWDGRERHLVGI